MYSQNVHPSMPKQQSIGQILPPVPVGMEPMNNYPPPPGALANGTRVKVTKYQVIIHNFIAEGGYAHVYLATIEGKSGYVVLKRVAVPDKERLQTVEKEIMFMRRLGDHKHIVRYYASRVDPLPTGGFEAFILMEYCPGGGVIDLMNRRMQQRLTESEILKIFSDVCEALAYMHYCNPPVLHRDLKVENILILDHNHYKLCDFGSAVLSRGSHVPSTLQEIQQLDDEIQRHTTLQYRAPEMIDIYQKNPINEKADIWALGVLLYKLCYYATPFDNQSQLAILNAKYTIPDQPSYSEELRQLISLILRADQNKRPDIYQVMKTVSNLRNVPCPIRDIQRDEQKNGLENDKPESPSIVFEKLSPSQKPKASVTPMRRGRPEKQPLDSMDAFSPRSSRPSPKPQTSSMSFESDFQPQASSSPSQSSSTSNSSPRDSPDIRSNVAASIESRFKAMKREAFASTKKPDVRSDSPLGRNGRDVTSVYLESHTLNPVSIYPKSPIHSDSTAKTSTTTTSKPAPPPKPARLRAQTNHSFTTPNALQDFEKLFPSVDQLRSYLP